MVGLIAFVICFITASHLQGPWAVFAVVCGLIQALSWWLHNSQATYESHGGRMGPGDLVAMALLGTVGFAGSLICLAILLFHST